MIQFKVFDIFDMNEIKVNDPAIAPYINISGRLLIKAQGRNEGKFSSAKVHILERLANRIAVPGHIGKKHKIITSWASGKYSNNMNILITALTIIEKRKNSNPVQILIKAIENCAPREEITTIEYGGARYPQAVDVAPSRRINLALRWITQGAYHKCFGKKKKIAQSLADEIINASDGNMDSYALQKKNEAEKQADAAR